MQARSRLGRHGVNANIVIIIVTVDMHISAVLCDESTPVILLRFQDRAGGVRVTELGGAVLIWHY